MEARFKLARILVTIAAVFLALVPPLVDLNESHVTNPLWIGHARLHTVWLITTNSCVSVIALWLLWQRPSGFRRKSLLLAAGLVGSVLLGFFVAAATQSAYGGSLTDPNGVAMRFGPIDANLFLFSILLCLVGVAVAIVCRPRA